MLRSFFKQQGILSGLVTVALSAAALGIGLLATLQPISPAWQWPVAWTFILLAGFASLGLVAALYFKVEAFFSQRRRALQILSPTRWTCHYWPITRTLKVSVPLDVFSNADITRIA
ncbi:MAG: hypothetical protein AAB369_02055, partial [Chloroflexota bacterium]